MTTTDVSKVCVVYCRVSSDKQATEEKDSLPAQERAGLAKAAELGLRVLYTVKDAESAWVLEKRSKFRQVLADAKAGKFGVTIVDRMNRFTRGEDLSDFMEVMTELKAAGVTPIFVQRDYERDPRTGKLTKTGSFMQFVDAYASAIEQSNRIAQALVGKRARAHRDKRPLPGSWALYGYRWLDAAKTAMEKDPGESGRVVERIWRSFLHEEGTTQAGMAKRLNREGVKTPREYAGIKTPKNARPDGLRWTATTIAGILHNPVYWGGDEDGTVTTFTDSKYDEPVRIPVYAPPYVAREEAARVHARLESNQRYASRHRNYPVTTLLHGGLVRCGDCGWALTPFTYKRPRADGSLLTVYRCMQANQHGKAACTNGAISAETLDYAVIDTLDQELAKGHFLDELFDAWDRDAEAALGSVRSIEQTLRETREHVANAMARLATYAVGDPLAAPLEAQARMLQKTIPGLEEKRRKALEAVQRARANPALRDELREWFGAWMFGFWELSRDRQRDFLKAIRAQVVLWPEGAHTPRAQLRIKLPTAPLALPPAPDSTLRPDPETGGWLLDVDTAVGVQIAAAARQPVEFLDAEPPASDTTPDEVMAQVQQTLEEQGYGAAVARRRLANAPIALGPSGRTGTRASSSSCGRPTSRA